MSWALSILSKDKRVTALLVAMLFILAPNTIYSASVYNSSLKPQRVQIAYKDGSHYFVTVYNSSTHFFDCIDGCEVTLVSTGHSRTLDSDTVVIIDDGKLRVR